MPPNHLNLYHPLLLLPSILPSIRVFSDESTLLTEAEYIKKKWQGYTEKLYQKKKKTLNDLSIYYHVQKVWILAFTNFVLILLPSLTKSGNDAFYC